MRYSIWVQLGLFSHCYYQSRGRKYWQIAPTVVFHEPSVAYYSSVNKQVNTVNTSFQFRFINLHLQTQTCCSAYGFCWFLRLWRSSLVSISRSISLPLFFSMCTRHVCTAPWAFRAQLQCIRLIADWKVGIFSQGLQRSLNQNNRYGTAECVNITSCTIPLLSKQTQTQQFTLENS